MLFLRIHWGRKTAKRVYLFFAPSLLVVVLYYCLAFLAVSVTFMSWVVSGFGWLHLKITQYKCIACYKGEKEEERERLLLNSWQISFGILFWQNCDFWLHKKNSRQESLNRMQNGVIEYGKNLLIKRWNKEIQEKPYFIT